MVEALVFIPVCVSKLGSGNDVYILRADLMSVLCSKTTSVQNCTLNREVPFDGGGGGGDDGEEGKTDDEGQDLRLPRFKSCFHLNYFECNSTQTLRSSGLS